MANRYWVGTVTSWNNILSWSTTSGGAPGASVPGASDAAILNASSGSGNVTLDISPTIQTLNCTGFTGTIAFGTNTITLNSTGTVFVGDTTYSVSGTPLIILSNATTTATRTINASAVTEANSISFNITAGSGTAVITVTGGGAVRNLNFTGFTGSHNATSYTVYGNLTLNSGMTVTAGSTTTFSATSGTKTITTNGVTFDKNITFNGAGGTWQLNDALTSGATRTTTLTAGTLNLNNNTLTTGIFSTSGTVVRTLAFGTGSIYLTAAGINTIYTSADSTNYSVSGSRTVVVTGVGTSGNTRTITGGQPSLGGTEANALDFYITAGADTLSLGTANRVYRTLDFTGFSGTLATNVAPFIYGNLALSSFMTVAGGTNGWTFKATSGTKTINVQGLSIDNNIVFDGVGGTWQLLNALYTGSTRSVTLTNGTLQLNNYTLSTSVFSSNNTNARTITFGTGSIIVTGNLWDTTDVTNLTTDASGTISMSSISAKVFNGGGRTWGKLLNSGIGTLTITGANTFMEINNSIVPAFFVFPAGQTTSAYTYTINGVAGNLVSLRSSSPGTQYTLAKL